MDRGGKWRGHIIAALAFVWAVAVLGAYYASNFEYYRTQFVVFARFFGL